MICFFRLLRRLWTFLCRTPPWLQTWNEPLSGPLSRNHHLTTNYIRITDRFPTWCFSSSAARRQSRVNSFPICDKINLKRFSNPLIKWAIALNQHCCDCIRMCYVHWLMESVWCWYCWTCRHHCNSLLYGLPDYPIQRLQYVMNAAAKVITCKQKLHHVTPLLIELHWLPVR